MYRKRISRLTYIILAFLLLVMGCGSLMATYTYDAGTVSPISTSYEAQLAKWDYTPEQIRKILEGLNESGSKLTIDIQAITDNLPAALKWFLNLIFGNPIISNETSIGSMDSNTTIRGDMKEFTVDGLSWILYFPEGMDKTYYLFVTESDLSTYTINNDCDANLTIKGGTLPIPSTRIGFRTSIGPSSKRMQMESIKRVNPCWAMPNPATSIHIDH